MKVLLINPLGGLGGSERSLLDVIESLRAARPDIVARLLVLEDGELALRARSLGIEVDVEPLPAKLRELGEAGPFGALPELAELARALARVPGFVVALRRRVAAIAPDIVHTNGMKAHVLFALALRDWPLVVHLRDFASERPISRYVLRALPRRALVLTNSRAVERDVLELAPRLRTRVVYNGIDTNAFRPGETETAYLAEQSGLLPPAPGTLSIGLVATYAWWKGHQTFIAAAARAKELVAEIPLRFYLVGGPIYATRGSDITLAELRRAIEERGLGDTLGLVPFQNDAPRVYRGLDLVVHASTRPEPFGRTIVEAMASGRPVVVSRAGGALELFEEGVSGLGFEPGDSEALAGVLARLARDPDLRLSLGENARKVAVARFDRARLGSEVSSAYEALLSRY